MTLARCLYVRPLQFPISEQKMFFLKMPSHDSKYGNKCILTISQLDEPLGHTVTVQEKKISLLL